MEIKTYSDLIDHTSQSDHQLMNKLMSLTYKDIERIECYFGIVGEAIEVHTLLSDSHYCLAIMIDNKEELMIELGDLYWYWYKLLYKCMGHNERSIFNMCTFWEYGYNQKSLSINNHVQMLSTKLVTLCGNLSEDYKKHLMYGREINPSIELDRLKHIISIVTLIVDSLGHTMDDLRSINTKKLLSRYENGYNAFDAINRKENK